MIGAGQQASPGGPASDVGGAGYLAAVTDEANLQTTRDSYDRVAGQYTAYVREVFPTDRVD